MQPRSPDGDGRVATCDPRKQRLRRSKVLVVWLSTCLALTFLIVEAPRVAAPTGALQEMYSGLAWPDAFAFAPDGRIFFAERLTGNIRIIENGVLRPDAFYSIPEVDPTWERGFLGLTLAPAFAANPWVYAYYTLNDTTNGTIFNRLIRLRATGNTGGSPEILLDRIPAAIWHNGGPIEFGPDGKLWVNIGDALDTAAAQDLLSVSGKVLRMNPDGSVPSDNPFVGNPSANPYVYTYGHRSIFGLTFHPVTNRTFITENGPECNDEINLLIPGRNYGWGPHETCSTPPAPPLNTNRDGPNPVLPLTYYTPTIAPTNAIIYNGSNFTGWYGDLFFGTWNTHNIHRLHLAPPNYDTILSDTVIVTVPDGVLDLEVGPDGAIWFSTPGSMYRFYDTAKQPSADFTFAPATPGAGEPVAFDASASSDPNRTIVSYDWRFGDGATGTGVTTTHAYAAPGSYSVNLTVLDNESLSNTRTRVVHVNIPPTAAFTVLPPTPIANETVVFNGSTSHDPEGAIASFEWTLGDGTALSGPEVSHAYGIPGTYVVTLRVTDSLGAIGQKSDNLLVGAPNRQPSAVFTISASLVAAAEPVTFNGSASSDPDGLIVTYAWTFGDGARGSGVVVLHAYALPGLYTVELTVTDNNATSDSAIGSVRVNALPVAVFTFEPSRGYKNLAMRFNGSASSDPDGLIDSYLWDFGDGGTDSGKEVSHAYTARGTFTVALSVVDNSGASNTTTAAVVIANAAPAILAVNPSVASVRMNSGETMRLSVNASDPDGDPLTFTWRVDGMAVQGSGPSFDIHPAGPGTYVVNVTVSDGDRASSYEWTVTAVAPAGEAALFRTVIFGLAIGIAFVVALAAGLLIIARRRRSF